MTTTGVLGATARVRFSDSRPQLSGNERSSSTQSTSPTVTDTSASAIVETNEMWYGQTLDSSSSTIIHDWSAGSSSTASRRSVWDSVIAMDGWYRARAHDPQG